MKLCWVLLLILALFACACNRDKEEEPPHGTSDPPDDTSTTVPEGYQVAFADIDGSPEPGKLTAGEPITFYVRLDNNTDLAIEGFSHGLLIYPQGEAVDWGTPTGEFTDELKSIFDPMYFLTSWTGSDIDTVAFSAATGTGGLAAGFNDIAFMLQLGPIPEDYVGMTICIDSTGFIPEHPWKWVFSDASFITPTWQGETCFEIVAPE